MTWRALLLLAFALAMDATAVAAARGLAVPRVRARHAVLVAVFFGGFQALMPLLGYLVGRQLGPALAAWDHWIAFVLLGGLGAKMLWEARGAGADAVPTEGDPFGLRVMLVLALATSVDALAAGLTLPLLGAPLAVSLACIGITTAALSVAGLYAGRRLGALAGPRLARLGGVVLVGLGVKILIEHLTAR